MRKPLKIALIALACILALYAAWHIVTRIGLVAVSEEGLVMFPSGEGFVPGDVVDSLDGVYVYYNGSVGNTFERNTASGGYNIGLEYQCVEFVKRYYYERYRHKMPDPWGHARDFFQPRLKDGKWNERRGLTQFHNGTRAKPMKGDLVVFDATARNAYGHVAIVSSVGDGEIEIIQQNPGPKGKSRVKFPLKEEEGIWTVDNGRLLGWLRKTDQVE